MKGYIRNKVIFYGDGDQLKEIREQLGSGEEEEALQFERVIPLEDSTPDGMKTAWGIKTRPEEMESILYRNMTVLEYSFNTEETAPLPVFRKLAELYPDIPMSILYASDDYGEFCGHFEKDAGSGELKEKKIVEPLVFACDLWGIDPDEELQERMINAYEE